MPSSERHAARNARQALKIEGRLEHVDNPADTYLNACAVLSQRARGAPLFPF